MTANVVTDGPFSLTSPLEIAAGRKQSVRFSITAAGPGNLYLHIPLGNGAKDLCALSPDAFRDNERTIVIVEHTFGSEDSMPEVTGREMSRDLSAGIVKITVAAGGSFALSLQDIAVGPLPGLVAFELRKGAASLGHAVLTKVERGEALSITRLEASPANRVGAGPVTLSFAFEPALGAPIAGRDYELSIKPPSALSAPLACPPAAWDAARKSWSTRTMITQTCDIEIVTKDDNPTNRQVRVRVNETSRYQESELCFSPPDAASAGTLDWGVLGIYPDDGAGILYVLLQHHGSPTPQASLWSTKTGFDSGMWEPVLNDRGDPARIPLDAARRPGAIYDGKLWLVGGDCCDPDRPDNGVGYFHLRDRRWINAAPAKWPKRMGHRVLVVADELWVIGGWSQDGGALGDIWTFKAGEGWREKGFKPPKGWKPRCLFGTAVTGGAVIIAGGFGTPGGLTYNDVLRWDPKSDAYESLPNLNHAFAGGRSTSESLAKLQYCASTVFDHSRLLDSRPDDVAAIAVYYEPGKSYRQKLFRFKKGNTWEIGAPIRMNDISSNNIFLELDFFCLSSAIFSGSIFLWELSPADPQDARLRRLILI